MKLLLAAVGLALLVLVVQNVTGPGPSWIAALDAVAAVVAFMAARSLKAISDAAGVGLAAFLAILLFIGGWGSAWAEGPRWLTWAHLGIGAVTLLSLTAAIAAANVGPRRPRARQS